MPSTVPFKRRRLWNKPAAALKAADFHNVFSEFLLQSVNGSAQTAVLKVRGVFKKRRLKLLPVADGFKHNAAAAISLSGAVKMAQQRYGGGSNGVFGIVGSNADVLARNLKIFGSQHDADTAAISVPTPQFSAGVADVAAQSGLQNGNVTNKTIKDGSVLNGFRRMRCRIDF